MINLANLAQTEFRSRVGHCAAFLEQRSRLNIGDAPLPLVGLRSRTGREARSHGPGCRAWDWHADLLTSSPEQGAGT